jgi:hypothetical protein
VQPRTGCGTSSVAGRCCNNDIDVFIGQCDNFIDIIIVVVVVNDVGVRANINNITNIINIIDYACRCRSTAHH